MKSLLSLVTSFAPSFYTVRSGYTSLESHLIGRSRRSLGRRLRGHRLLAAGRDALDAALPRPPRPSCTGAIILF